MKTVPLRYRLPNPPTDFVGRQEELASVAASLRDAHVTVLVGPGGVGKTALALQTLHKRFPKRVERTLYVSLAGELDGLDLRRELLRALAAAAGVEIGWSQLQDNCEALSEALLDLAEAGPFWVLLDELQHVVPGEAESLLEALSLYARNSRYLVVSRTAPQTQLASARVVPIGGLDEEATVQLARQLGAGLTPAEIQAAARACGGSPWLLREALTSSSTSGQDPSLVSHHALLEGLGESARRVSLALSRVDVSVPPALLSESLELSESEWRPELSARGWLQQSPAGVRLHEVARQGVTRGGEAPADPKSWLSLARNLAHNPTGNLRLEGVRLLLEADGLDEAEECLGESLSQLLAEGYAPQLWKLLSRIPAGRLNGVRLRCAAELGNPTVLRQLSQPLGGSATDRLTWAETLYMRGDLTGALETLKGLLAEASRDLPPAEAAACRFDAELLRARLLIAQDRIEEARLLLGGLVPSTGQQATRRESLLLSCAPIDLEDEPECHRVLGALQNLEHRSTELKDRIRARVRFQLAVAYLRLHALDAAEAVLETPPPGDVGDTLALFETRRATWLQAAIDLARGHLDSAEGRIAQLEPFLSSPSLIRAEVQCTRARLRMARGDFAELLPLLREAQSEAETLGVLATAHRAEHLLDRVEEILLVGEGKIRQKVRSERFLDHLETATRDLERSTARQLAHGRKVRAAEQRAEYCVGLLLLGRTADLEREVAELRRLALEMGSLRWQAEADLLSQARGIDWGRLEAIAQRPEVSPSAARRARALLGETTWATDPLDRAVVDKLRSGNELHRVVPASAEDEWQPGWGLDLTRRCLWLPSGEWLDLTRRGLLARLVAVLAQYGGSASKEQLVQEVWEESEYHPLRHDTRLQVSVHKLRELLEEDAGSPRLLVTTATGYALAGPFRLAGERPAAPAQARAASGRQP